MIRLSALQSNAHSSKNVCSDFYVCHKEMLARTITFIKLMSTEKLTQLFKMIWSISNGQTILNAIRKTRSTILAWTNPSGKHLHKNEFKIWIKRKLKNEMLWMLLSELNEKKLSIFFTTYIFDSLCLCAYVCTFYSRNRHCTLYWSEV